MPIWLFVSIESQNNIILLRRCFVFESDSRWSFQYQLLWQRFHKKNKNRRQNKQNVKNAKSYIDKKRKKPFSVSVVKCLRDVATVQGRTRRRWAPSKQVTLRYSFTSTSRTPTSQRRRPRRNRRRNTVRETLESLRPRLYTIRPLVKSVEQPAALCKQTFNRLLFNRLFNRFGNRLYRVNEV